MSIASSYRLPILVALPIVAALIAGGVYLAVSDPEPPPQPNVEPEPKPLDDAGDDGESPSPLNPGPDVAPVDRYPNSPDSPAVAEAMTAEAFAGLDTIRSRLELKFKYADYTHDHAWTVAGIVRRPERLTGEYFEANDFSLRFEDASEPVVQIQVVSSKTTPLPDGPITLQVDLRTGESEPAGFVLARNANGGVLLPDDHYKTATHLLLRLASSWQELTQMPEESRHYSEEDMERYAQWFLDPFSPDDVVSGMETPSGIEFSLRTFHGHGLAWPAVLTLGADGSSGSISGIPAETWMPVPATRTEVIESLRYSLEYRFEDWPGTEENEEPPRDRDASVSNLLSSSELRRTVSCFGDWTLQSDETQHTLTLNSSYGRPLPFGVLKYLYNVKTGEGRFLDS